MLHVTLFFAFCLFVCGVTAAALLPLDSFWKYVERLQDDTKVD